MRMFSTYFFTAQRSPHQSFRGGRAQASKNFIVNRHRWCLIAAAQAAHILNLDIFGPRACKTAQQFGTQFAGGIQVAAHVGTHADFRLGRRDQMKMRIKAGYAVELVERSLRVMRKRFQLRLRQVTVAQLNGPQVVKDHRE